MFHTLSHKIRALPSRHTLHSSLGIASKKPVRSPGWVLCPSEVPRKPHGPADGTLYAGTKCPSLICPVSRASSPGLDTLWLACVWNEHSRVDASQQRARGWGSAHLGLIPAPHTTTLNSPFTSSGFLLPLTQRRQHLVSLQLKMEDRKEAQISFGATKAL